MDPLRALQIDHVELLAPDRTEAAAWYEQVLGLEVLAGYRDWAEDPSGPLMISGDGGSTKLVLFTGQPQEARVTAGFHRVAFRVTANGFIEFLRRLASLDLRDHRG